MCGIVGYIGEKKAKPILINGLLNLEYRGYDSAGISTLENGKICTIKNKGRVFSISQIYENVWEEESFGTDNIIAVHIRHIREKIEINPKEPKYLKVIWGIGYKIENL